MTFLFGVQQMSVYSDQPDEMTTLCTPKAALYMSADMPFGERDVRILSHIRSLRIAERKREASGHGVGRWRNPLPKAKKQR